MFKNYFIESKLLEDLPMLCKQTLGAIQSVSVADRLPCHRGHGLDTYKPFECLPCIPLFTTHPQDMIKHVGEEVNIEHFFAVLSLSMFSRYSINATFDNVGEETIYQLHMLIMPYMQSAGAQYR